MRVVVVGGGISGLAAAYRLVERGVNVVLVEQGTRLGGRIRTGEIAGGPVELGAEAFAVRDPHGRPSAAIELVEALGLAGSVAYPAIQKAALAMDGGLVPFPGGTLMGVPGDLARLDGFAVADRDRDTGAPVLTGDVAVGALVRERLGDEVADRLVDPMLGGVYAGRADDLSLEVTMPALADACRREHTLTGAVRAALADRPAAAGPIFATIIGGMDRLVDALEGRLRDRIRRGLAVRELAPAVAATDVAPAGVARWRLVVGSTRDAGALDADGVVLAVPAAPAGRLLSGVGPAAAALVGGLDYASVALVTLALPGVKLPELSGFLVPASSGYTVKAATFFDRKWAHLDRPGVTVVRASLGRYGDEAILQCDDPSLAALAHTELGRLLGEPLPAPIETRVQRWGGALPQYRPGHIGRTVEARNRLPATITLAGAAYDGVGIPACIRSGQVAADRLLRGLGT
jgi:oxygen-dependent protoporphyrinogen oxidase